MYSLYGVASLRYSRLGDGQVDIQGRNGSHYLLSDWISSNRFR